MRRVALAFLFAPAIGLVIGAAVAASIATVLTGWAGITYFFLLVFVGAFTAYALAFVVGVPVYFLLPRAFIQSPLLLSLIGICIGGLGWSLGKSPIVSSDFYLRAGIEAVFALVSATVGALAFWYIGIRGDDLSLQEEVENAP
jgi:hypothetical protein